MLKVKIYTLGRTKEHWLQEGLAEYEKRLSRWLQVEWVFPKESEWAKTLNALPSWIALDVAGELVNSVQLSAQLMKEFERGGSRLHLAIGGAEGWTPETLSKSAWRWSLSPLTFTHQMTRLIVLEQLYRALEIENGGKYHK